MSAGGDWQGEPHTLIVGDVEDPDGTVGDCDLEYEIQHPPSCKQREEQMGQITLVDWDCAVAHMAAEGLAFSLNYSGTPITEPGTYRVQAWGTKTYYHESGYEYDAGVALVPAGEEAQ